jgi:hypothetical protein
MEDVDEFSAAPVIAWLMYTRDTMRELLYYSVRTIPNVNIIYKGGRKRLEIPCVKLLSLSYVSMSVLDLSLLLTACPRLEILALVNRILQWS